MTPASHRVASRRVVPVALAALLLAHVQAAQAPAKFYPDDPLPDDVETEDASGAAPWVVADIFDFAENTFTDPGEPGDRPAAAVNTLDEAYDSSWFTNRLGAREMTIDEIVRGPDRGDGPADGVWTIISGKTQGISPGFTVRDSRGDVYFLKFDPPSNPEMATGAEVISTKFFHAFGYNTPENYLAFVTRDRLKVGEQATTRDAKGYPHKMSDGDVDVVLARAARRDDGSYRVVASKALDGKALGPFRYYGLRPDDPNDVTPHERRRDLRGLRAMAAWLNHDDSRSLNTLDMLEDGAGGRRVVRHYLLDFGSTLGSGSVAAQKPRAGYEYLFEAGPTFKSMATLGLYLRPWMRIDYPSFPSIGRIEADVFDPERWRGEYPNPAFVRARPEDLFWGARRVAALSEQAIRAVVGTARFSDPAAERFLGDVLIARRDKVARAWLNGVAPVVDVQLSRTGVLTFSNAAVAAGAASPPERYRIEWASFDNRTGAVISYPVRNDVPAPPVEAPFGVLLERNPEFLVADISITHAGFPHWATPVRVYFRRAPEGWTTVGVERAGARPN